MKNSIFKWPKPRWQSLAWRSRHVQNGDTNRSRRSRPRGPLKFPTERGEKRGQPGEARPPRIADSLARSSISVATASAHLAQWPTQRRLDYENGRPNTTADDGLWCTTCSDEIEASQQKNDPRRFHPESLGKRFSYCSNEKFTSVRSIRLRPSSERLRRRSNDRG